MLVEKGNLLTNEGRECRVTDALVEALGAHAKSPKHKGIANETTHSDDGPIDS